MELDGCIQIFALLFIGHVTFNRSLKFSVPHFPNPNFPMIPTSSGCGKDNLLCNVELLAQCLVLSKHSKDVICCCSHYQQSKLILSVDWGTWIIPHASMTQIAHFALLWPLLLSSAVIGLMALCEGAKPFDVGVKSAGLDSFKGSLWGAQALLESRGVWCLVGVMGVYKPGGRNVGRREVRRCGFSRAMFPA